MKKLLFLLSLVLSLSLLSCDKEKDKLGDISDKKVTSRASNFSSPTTTESIAVVDFRIRSINDTQYVKEIHLKDFSSQNLLGDVIGTNNEIYTDDGNENDLDAGDGIYTSLTVYTHDVNVPYNNHSLVTSYLSNSIVHPDFMYMSELNNYLQDYNIYKYEGNDESGPLFSKPGVDITVGIECPVTFGTCGCYAHKWGWCDCCCIGIDIDNCKVYVEGGVSF